MTRRACAALLLLAAACASAPPRRAIVPLADHHQHLLGPTALPKPEPLLPAVALPPELDRLLAERARVNAHAKTVDDLAAVFTEDAQALLWKRPSRWVRGRSALLDVANQVSPLVFRYQPNAYALDGSAGYVAGTVMVGEGESAVGALDFLLGLEKGSDGAWRIAAESTTIRSAAQYSAPITADKVIADLNEAGIRRAIVLSVAFWLADYDAVRAENDWVAAEVARHSGRLFMACSARVLREYAVAELDRCAKMPQVRAFKLHFGDGNVDLNDAAQLDKVKRFFAAANALRMPIIVHLAPQVPYGPKEVGIFLRDVMAQAPDIPVQIAHLAGDGPGITSPEALAAFAAFAEARAKNLYFDFAGLVTAKTKPEEAQLMVARMRQLGLDRILYGSDGQPPNAPTAEHWTQTIRKLPFTDEELRIIANNVAPWMR